MKKNSDGEESETDMERIKQVGFIILTFSFLNYVTIVLNEHRS